MLGPNDVWAASASAGSEWVESFTLFDDDGTLMNITNKTFEFVIRASLTDSSPTPLVEVTSSGATAQGYITVTAAASSLMVVLSPAALTDLPATGPWHTLWMDPGLPDQTKILSGPFFCQPTAAP